MSTISLKCPNCGGELLFDPKTQNYKCEYCMSAFTQGEIESLTPVEEVTEQSQDTQEVEANLYLCPSCGAEIVADETTTATFCYYCHNPVVLSGKMTGDMMPDDVIPFQIDRKEAEKRFLDYVQKKRFIPKAFFNKKQIEMLSGVYFPYWVCDSKSQGTMDAEARNMRVWRMGDVEYTETKHFAVEREGELELREMTKNALKKANSELIDGVMPYLLKDAKPFQMGYLSGFLAERRDIEYAAYEDEINQDIQKYGEALLRNSIKGYGSVSVRHCNIEPKEKIWSYVYLPVWTITYKGKDGKVYYYSLNGQTGKVYGELPISQGRVWKFSGAIAAVVLVLGLIGGYFL
ncbi:TFIIB-type zinc ribbon-containing protein [Chakrabartyella piscis]|uniref:TFIIB-type zinc ribbon-containing protein n=1 Tax=Chakrabartyella piscis TaxID=2918914 RepID=UPI00295834C0|nr:TFIIB-type zinc ribbon-containing protein [Chakrabartyella piscis]